MGQPDPGPKVRHYQRALCWLKRDLRLSDHAALAQALTHSHDVLPAFWEEPSWLAASDTSPMHISAVREALKDLRQQLQSIHADLYFAADEVLPGMMALRAVWPFEAIFAHEEIGNDRSFARDRAVRAWCAAQGIDYFEVPQSSVRRGGVNRDRFARLWQSRIAGTPPLPRPTRFRQLLPTRRLAAYTTLPVVQRDNGWQPVSEAAAQETLHSFLQDRGRYYSGGISSPNTALHHGSRLSVHLAYGTLSVRAIWHATQARLSQLDPQDPGTAAWRRSLQNFQSRLHWRDHFTQRLESEPQLEFQALHPHYRQVPYSDRADWLEAWVHGRTGFPLVDAVMRCLQATGFVNFRMRAMIVSVACHLLHLDWRTIHPPLARIFRDYDAGIHLNQLQMQAGVVGWNTIRVYSPQKQLEEQDPRGVFVRRWVPELRGYDRGDAFVGAAGHGGYPAPLADWATQTAQMKAWLFGLRKTADPQVTAAVYRRHGSRVAPMTRRRPPATRKARPQKPERPDQPTLF